jgi:hypothetical protein
MEQTSNMPSDIKQESDKAFVQGYAAALKLIPYLVGKPSACVCNSPLDVSLDGSIECPLDP